jgi:hypothetical protein
MLKLNKSMENNFDEKNKDEKIFIGKDFFVF